MAAPMPPVGEMAEEATYEEEDQLRARAEEADMAFKGFFAVRIPLIGVLLCLFFQLLVVFRIEQRFSLGNKRFSLFFRIAPHLGKLLGLLGIGRPQIRYYLLGIFRKRGNYFVVLDLVVFV